MNTGDTILIVDDDPRIRELLRSSLEAENFTVLEADSGTSLHEQLSSASIDLITMDVVLDRENGLDLVRDIRKRSELPIILISGRVDLIDTVVGLELGADDYVTKPFLVRELIARVRSVLRRSRSTKSGSSTTASSSSNEASDKEQLMEIVRFGCWSVNTASRELRNCNNKIVNLTTTEYDLLEIFLSNPKRVLSRDQLMERLTGRDWHPTGRVVDNHIAQLRKKIEQNDGTEWIKTIRGTGYMFTSKTVREASQE